MVAQTVHGNDISDFEESEQFEKIGRPLGVGNAIASGRISEASSGVAPRLRGERIIRSLRKQEENTIVG